MMDQVPSILTLLQAVLIDSFDTSVLLLLTTGVFLFIPLQIIHGLRPLFLAAIITAEIGLNFPLPPIYGGITWFAILWIPTLLLIFYTGWHKIYRESPSKDRPPILSLAAPGITLLGCIILFLTAVITHPPHNPLEWPAIHACGFLLILFFLIGEIAPWKFFSLKNNKDTAWVLIYVAIGLFIIRGAMWNYGLFHASIKERPGSFRMKGIHYAKQLSQGWRFHSLSSLIDTYWYYPNYPNINEQLQSENVESDSMTTWRNEGLQNAESFRRDLLLPDSRNHSKAEWIIQAILDFQEQSSPSLQGHITLKRFTLDSETLIELIRGSDYEEDPRETLGIRMGRWFGSRDSSMIQNRWNPLEFFMPPLTIPGTYPLQLHATQFGRIGNGMSCTASASIPGVTEQAPSRSILLGTIFSPFPQSTQNAPASQPSLGLSVGYNQLIWITPELVLFEEVIPNIQKNKEKYAITGFNYSFDRSILQIQGDCFQGVLTKYPSGLEPFYSFELNLSVTIE